MSGSESVAEVVEGDRGIAEGVDAVLVPAIRFVVGGSR